VALMPKNMQKIRMKLQYEWKNIYRSLSSTDTNDVGMVSRKQFDDILQNYGVFISNEELKMLVERFNGGNGS
jgi:Ca2+-binding EF-hand superfamily protein